jgi:hypothetical protein
MYVNNNKMSARGPTFDGLYDEQIITQQDIISTNYVATNPSNQYATSAMNMDLTAVATNPTFSFKNSVGALTGTVAAAKVSLFSNSEMTTTSVTALTAQTTDTTAVVINNNSVNAALTVGKITPSVERGLGMQVTTQSVDKAALALTNTQSSSCSILQALAPNLPTTGKASVLIGKDNSTTGNSYTIGTVVDSPSTTNRLEINSFGETNPAMQIYKKATLATSATTGSVVVPGDLTCTTKVSSKSLVLYGTSSGSAAIQAASVTTTPYTLTLPNTLGTSGQYLTLGTPVGSVAPLSWTTGTGGGGGTTQSTVYGRLITTSQTVANNTDYTVLFDSGDSNTDLGTVPISYDTSNGRFTNTSGGSSSFIVSYQVNFSSNNTNSRQTWIEKNGNAALRYGQNSTAATQGTKTIVNGAAFITVADGEYFTLRAYQNSGSTLDLFTTTNSSTTKIQISQAVSPTALQSVSLTTPSPLLSVSGSPAVGPNPTLSFTTTSPPTGTGTTIVLGTSPTITTPTLATPTITGTTTSTGEIVAPSFDGKTVKNTEQFLVKYTDFGFSGNNQSITMIANSGTFRRLVHNFANCRVRMPNATLFNIGTTYRIKNLGTSFSTAIQTNDGLTTIGFSTIGGIIDVILDDNSTANGVWDIQGMLNHSSVEANNLGLAFKNGAYLSLANTTDFKVNTKTDPTQSVNYNWIYPTTAGTVGQVLTSSAGSTLTWSDALTSSSTLAINGGGNVIGTSFTIVNSTPTLTINGTQTQTGQGTLRVTTSSLMISSALVASFLNPVQGVNASLYLALGRSLSFGNSATPGFTYFGDNLSANHYYIGMYGKAASVKVYSPSTVATTNQASLLVNGGTTTESLYVNGATTLQATTATSVTTNSIVVIPDPGQPAQTRQLTFDYGSRTPTLYWAVNNTSQDPAVTLIYPLYPGVVGFTNQHYDWQQVGKQYSFTLSIVISVIQVLNYDMLCPFINDCFPPTPAMGSYAQYETSTDIPYRFGTYIPAT